MKIKILKSFFHDGKHHSAGDSADLEPHVVEELKVNEIVTELFTTKEEKRDKK